MRQIVQIFESFSEKLNFNKRIVKEFFGFHENSAPSLSYPSDALPVLVLETLKLAELFDR